MEIDPYYQRRSWVQWL